LVPQVLARERDGPAVVVLDHLVLPEEARGSAEHWPTKDETLSNQVIEQAKCLSTRLTADHHLKILHDVSFSDDLYRRHRAAIDDVFGARDRPCSGRGEKRDEVRHFFWFRGTSDRDAAERVHQHLSGAVVVGALLCGQFVDESNRAI